MSATVSGLIVLENPRPVDGLPSSVEFDGQMWLSPQCILTGIFRYYNSSRDTFPEIGHYFSWIHVCSNLHIFFIFTDIRQVAKFVPLVDATLEGEYVEVEQDADSEWRPKDTINEGVAESGDSTSLDTLKDPDVVHTVGDIIQVC
jgi:hypothetical protein